MKRKRFQTAVLITLLTGFSLFCGCSGKESSSWETVVPYEYDGISVSNQGNFIGVRKNDKGGVYVKNGETYDLLFSPEYDNITWPSNEEYLFLQTGDQIAIYQSNGKKLTDQTFTRVTYSAQNKGFEVLLENGYWGFLSEINGDWLIKPKYKTLISLYVDDRFFVQKENLEYDIIDSQENSTFPSDLRVSGWLYPDLFDVTGEDQSLHGIANLSGEVIVPISYQNISYFQYSDTGFLYICKDEDNRRSVFDEEGNALLKNMECDEIKPINSAYFVVKKDKKSGLMNGDGEWIIPMEYDDIYFSNDSNVGYVMKDFEFYFATLQGDIYKDVSYSGIRPIKESNGIFSVKKDGKIGLMDENRNIITPFAYDYCDISMYHDLLLLKKDGKYGFFSPQKQKSLAFAYDYASSFEKGYAKVVKDGKLGIIDSEGNDIVPFEFDPPFESGEDNIIVNLDSSNLITLKKDGKYGCIALKVK